jgi:hypothetical protein
MRILLVGYRLILTSASKRIVALAAITYWLGPVTSTGLASNAIGTAAYSPSSDGQALVIGHSVLAHTPTSQGLAKGRP